MDLAIPLERRRIDLGSSPSFQLGRAMVDPPAHEYRIGPVATRMQPQPLKVLVALHHKMNQVVTRGELVDRCWDGRIVGEDVINRSISLLRQFAKTSGGFEIQTVPRAGLPAGGWHSDAEAEMAALGDRRRSIRDCRGIGEHCRLWWFRPHTFVRGACDRYCSVHDRTRKRRRTEACGGFRSIS